MLLRTKQRKLNFTINMAKLVLTTGITLNLCFQIGFIMDEMLDS